MDFKDVLNIASDSFEDLSCKTSCARGGQKDDNFMSGGIAHRLVAGKSKGERQSVGKWRDKIICRFKYSRS